MLDEYLAAHPQSTLWNRRYAPLLRGEFALFANKPEDAVALMESSRQFDGASLDGYYRRGLADMQASRLSLAESEFRALLAHPFIEPASAVVPLAKLQLARVLVREGNKSAAAGQYHAFMESWKDADPGQPLLMQARSELANL